MKTDTAIMYDYIGAVHMYTAIMYNYITPMYTSIRQK